MIEAESRGDYDFSRAKDALVVSDESGQRIALFLDARRHGRDINGMFWQSQDCPVHVQREAME